MDDTVAELKEQLTSSTKEAAEIEVRLASAEKTISAAEGLVSKLDDEYTVWSKQVSYERQVLGNNIHVHFCFNIITPNRLYKTPF